MFLRTGFRIFRQDAAELGVKARDPQNGVMAGICGAGLLRFTEAYHKNAASTARNISGMMNRDHSYE